MRDNWCVGYTARFTVGVWAGNFSGAPMRDVSGITGAAPVWLEVMNYLHDRFGGDAMVRPAGLRARPIEFPHSVEPARLEWFIAGTEPNTAAARLNDLTPRILSPATDTIIALDPDIPPALQRVKFEAGPGAVGVALDTRFARPRPGHRPGPMAARARRSHPRAHRSLRARAGPRFIQGPRLAVAHLENIPAPPAATHRLDSNSLDG